MAHFLQFPLQISFHEVTKMAQELIVSTYTATAQPVNATALMLGAGLALTSMILLPALALRLGMSASLTGA
ncbi:MAG: hypothetical protein ABSB19_15185, partial [Methylomonas sp.]